MTRRSKTDGAYVVSWPGGPGAKPPEYGGTGSRKHGALYPWNE